MNNTMRRLQDLSNWQVLLILISTSVVASLFSGFSQENGFSTEWFAGYADNLSSEMLGAFLTFILLEMILGTREQKNDLLLNLASKDNATALNALKKIKESGWLTDGTLNGVNLELANLQDADLRQANMRNGNFRLANLEEAALIGADLQGANLHYTNLQFANLQVADMKGVTLQEADLRAANLRKANLLNAKIANVVCDEFTVLPSGELWSPDVNWEQFTNPQSPEFWQPDWIKTQPIHVSDLTPNGK